MKLFKRYAGSLFRHGEAITRTCDPSRLHGLPEEPDRHGGWKRRIRGILKRWQGRGLGCHQGRGQSVRKSPARWYFLLLSAASVCWFLVRVIPKPMRAAYPCQQAAFPLASAFVLWVLGLKHSLSAWARAKAPRLRPVVVPCTLVLVMAAVALGLRAAAGYFVSPLGWCPAEPANSPIGVARGIHPGRVVWTHDPSVSSWDGTTNYYYDDRYTSLSVAQSMLSRTIQKLSDQGTDAAAWDALFRYYNQTHGRGAGGYSIGEMITVKINCNNSPMDGMPGGNRIDATPQMVWAMLTQLVNAAGVPQTNVIVYDAQRDVSRIRSYCTNAFPKVSFIGYNIPNFFAPAVITFATNGMGTYAGRLPPFVTNATYSINLALLKRHCEVVDLFNWSDINGQAAITCCFKNHFGSSANPGSMHTMIRDWRNGMGAYNALVDLEGSRHLDGKTILYLIDGLYGGKRHDAVPVRWKMPPFSNNWPSSLFASQDIVAIDSVALDFLRTEWGLMPNADNFLHEAALANAPPSGFCYAPNGDGVRLASLGVHEHWNSPFSKQYSRNLSTNGTGIELATIHSGPGITVALTSPINNAVVNPLSHVTLQSIASSGYTGIGQVDYYGSGLLLGSSATSPYTFVWSNAPAGNWALTAVATDADYLSATSSVVNVTVASNDLAVVVSSPTNGAVLWEGSNITVQAVADSSFSAVRQVDFEADGSFLGTATNSHAAVVWSNPSPGSWSLSAIATDTNGLSALSAPVNITVRPANIAIAGTLYVDLRATNLSTDGTTWTNWGSLGNFAKYGVIRGVVNVAGTGIPGVDLSLYYNNAFVGPATAAELEGASARSVEVWAYEQSTAPRSNATMVAWSHGGGAAGTAFAMNHNLDSAGAALLGGSYDIGWGDATNFPPRRAWHHFVYTYDGATLFQVYVDGALQVAKTLPAPLNTCASEPILIGASSSVRYGMPEGSTRFLGYINSVRVHGGLLTAVDVANNFAAGPCVAAQPTTIRQVMITNSLVNITFGTIPGRIYYLEYTDSLNPQNWMPLPPTQALGTALTISDVLGGIPARFYRVAMKP